MNERMESFGEALQRLGEALQEEETDLIRDASIQRFEFCVELAWKSLQKYLEDEKILCQSPKSCLKEAFQLGLVEDDSLWMQMLDDRNLTVHTYKQQLAKDIYGRLSGYWDLLQRLHRQLSSKK
ncbi:MAG: nucleotidyltransferase substrate binding protein [Candidatus Uhrbacteria bacterium]|nr:nucleotidyltransferase substrate binding protein [Candidatus Uhrbacteria bacterium]